MAIAYVIEADTTAIREGVERLASVGGDLRRVLTRIGVYVRREAQRRLRGRRSDWGRSRGMLAKSLAMQVTPTMVRVGSALVYAAVQQLGTASLPGGAIRPKSPRKFLAIPVSGSLRTRGVWPRDLPKGSMKYVPNANIQVGSRRWVGPALVRAASTDAEKKLTGAQGRDAKGRYAQKGSGGGTLKTGEVMFALVRQVRIKGRPYLAFGPDEQAFALKTLHDEYQRAWRRSRGGA